MLRVREGRSDDAEPLIAFNTAMAFETEDKSLDPETVSRGVRRVLEDADRGTYLVAERHGVVTGSLYITREWSDWRDGWFWWIQSVFVRPEDRRAGVFRALYEEVVARARSAGDVCGLRLYVEDENHGAQQTYEQLGMRRAGYEMYEVVIAP